jgi:hypothetical protein
MFRSDLRPSSGGYKQHLYYVHMCLFNFMYSVEVTYNLHDKKQVIYTTHKIEQTHMDVI